MTGLQSGPCDEGVARGCRTSGPQRLTAGRRRLILAVTVLASGMAMLDGSVVNVALPAIQRDLGASGPAAAWVMNAYLLLLAALVLAGGAAGGLRGVGAPRPRSDGPARPLRLA